MMKRIWQTPECDRIFTPLDCKFANSLPVEFSSSIIPLIFIPNSAFLSIIVCAKSSLVKLKNQTQKNNQLIE